MTVSEHLLSQMTGDDDIQASHQYYFETGRGHWDGRFDFELIDWQAFLRDRIGIVNRVLVLGMLFLTTFFGEARITSYIAGDPERAPAGLATNEVRITKWGVTLYLLRERYHLHTDGRCVTVDARERFGPIPFLLSSRKAHPADILDDGLRAVYYMPLLGTDWVGNYDVRQDGTRIEATLSCDWARASEIIEHAGS